MFPAVFEGLLWRVWGKVVFGGAVTFFKLEITVTFIIA
jgi:hypothetical protein